MRNPVVARVAQDGFTARAVLAFVCALHSIFTCSVVARRDGSFALHFQEIDALRLDGFRQMPNLQTGHLL